MNKDQMNNYDNRKNIEKCLMQIQLKLILLSFPFRKGLLDIV